VSSQKPQYDFIIVGGGPAGLASAIFAARQKKSVILIEKGNKFGPEPRGETLHNNEILDELLGQGFMESIALSHTADREFYSPDLSQIIHKKRKTPSIVFRWEDWISGFIKALEGLNITIALNSEVIELILDQDIVCGVVYKDNAGERVKAFGNAILACDGYSSVVGRKLKIDYKKMNFPIIKCIMKRGNCDSKAFKFFFVPHGSLEYAPNFPPSIIIVFPREDKSLETGIMVQTDLMSDLNIPAIKESDITQVWVKLKDQYPIFSDLIRGGSITYEKLTLVPMTGPIEEFIPKKGVVMIGDAAGFVEVSGGSGLVSSILMAKFWVDTLIDIMKKTQERTDIWSDNNVQKMQKQFRNTKICKHIKKVAKIYTMFRRMLFIKMHTKENIVKKWGFIKFMMKFT
jgi:flavin-dependent dehydrogenase